MKQQLLRALWLAPDQLRSRTTRFTGWVGVVLGALILVGAVALHLTVTRLVADAAVMTQDCCQQLRTASCGRELTTKAAVILDAQQVCIERLVPPLSLSLGMLGCMALTHAVLLLRVHAVLNEPAAPALTPDRETT